MISSVFIHNFFAPPTYWFAMTTLQVTALAIAGGVLAFLMIVMVVYCVCAGHLEPLSMVSMLHQ